MPPVPTTPTDPVPAPHLTDVYRPASLRCTLVGRVSETKIRRTNINLDTELVDAAAAVLGTARTTDTVHAALRAVIDRAARERLAERDFADLTPDVLEQLRRPRRFA
jgi:Arc/MetJ family transcription regulator